MKRITRLPATLINQIAAGEVIERPAAVLKELVENSLDAGARQVEIALEEGGIRRLIVTDDGSGIPYEDLPLAFEPHATSKLLTGEDLARIGTLGFRGEALASIGAVSETVLTSRVIGDELGGRIEIRGGTLTGPVRWGMPGGTRVEVQDLFYNVPARRKYLKHPVTEMKHLSEQLIRLALPWPEVAFTMTHQGKLVHRLPAVGDSRERLRFFWGRIAEGLREYRLPVRNGTVHLFLGGPEMKRRTPDLEYLFVNRRHVRDRMLAHALREACAEQLMKGEYPAYFAFLELPPDEIDVNVHPTKIEIRFWRGRDWHAALLEAVAGAIRGGAVGGPGRETFPEPFPASLPAGRPGEPMRSPVRSPVLPGMDKETVRETVAVAPLDERVLGKGTVAALQVHATYLVEETPEGLAILDQHALHERILYEKMKREWQEGAGVRQKLLAPLLRELSRRDLARLLEHQEELRCLGLEIGTLGEDTLAVYALPSRLREDELDGWLGDLLAAESEGGKWSFPERTLRTLACRLSVKEGTVLAPAEIGSLLAGRGEVEYTESCNHGRPTAWRISREELDRYFRRGR